MGRRRSGSIEGRTFGRLERVVTTLVQAGLADRAAAPPNLDERLRDLERRASASGNARQVLQVIASGRRLLRAGDGAERVGRPAPRSRVDPLGGAALPPDVRRGSGG